MAADLRWPETLPQALEQEGAQFTPPAMGEVIDVSAKTNPPIFRQRAFAGVWKTRGSMRMTTDQYTRFDQWWRESANYGAVPAVGKILGSSEDEEFHVFLQSVAATGGDYWTVSLEIWRYR